MSQGLYPCWQDLLAELQLTVKQKSLPMGNRTTSCFSTSHPRPEREIKRYVLRLQRLLSDIRMSSLHSASMAT